MKKLIAAMSATALIGLLTPVMASAEEEQAVNTSDVPAAVQKAAESEAKGGKIVRWEKEGKNYEAVIEKNGKEWGFTFNGKGKMLGKHDESKEKGEKHED